MFCKLCGAENKDEALVCSVCGGSFKAQSEADEMPARSLFGAVVQDAQPAPEIVSGNVQETEQGAASVFAVSSVPTACDSSAEETQPAPQETHSAKSLFNVYVPQSVQEEPEKKVNYDASPVASPVQPADSAAVTMSEAQRKYIKKKKSHFLRSLIAWVVVLVLLGGLAVFVVLPLLSPYAKLQRALKNMYREGFTADVTVDSGGISATKLCTLALQSDTLKHELRAKLNMPMLGFNTPVGCFISDGGCFSVTGSEQGAVRTPIFEGEEGLCTLLESLLLKGDLDSVNTLVEMLEEYTNYDIEDEINLDKLKSVVFRIKLRLFNGISVKKNLCYSKVDGAENAYLFEPEYDAIFDVICEEAEPLFKNNETYDYFVEFMDEFADSRADSAFTVTFDGKNVASISFGGEAMLGGAVNITFTKIGETKISFDSWESAAPTGEQEYSSALALRPEADFVDCPACIEHVILSKNSAMAACGI